MLVLIQIVSLFLASPGNFSSIIMLEAEKNALADLAGELSPLRDTDPGATQVMEDRQRFLTKKGFEYILDDATSIPAETAAALPRQSIATKVTDKVRKFLDMFRAYCRTGDPAALPASRARQVREVEFFFRADHAHAKNSRSAQDEWKSMGTYLVEEATSRSALRKLLGEKVIPQLHAFSGAKNGESSAPIFAPEKVIHVLTGCDSTDRRVRTHSESLGDTHIKKNAKIYACILVLDGRQLPAHLRVPAADIGRHDLREYIEMGKILPRNESPVNPGENGGSSTQTNFHSADCSGKTNNFKIDSTSSDSTLIEKTTAGEMGNGSTSSSSGAASFPGAREKKNPLEARAVYKSSHIEGDCLTSIGQELVLTLLESFGNPIVIQILVDSGALSAANHAAGMYHAWLKEIPDPAKRLRVGIAITRCKAHQLAICSAESVDTLCRLLGICPRLFLKRLFLEVALI